MSVSHFREVRVFIHDNIMVFDVHLVACAIAWKHVNTV